MSPHNSRNSSAASVLPPASRSRHPDNVGVHEGPISLCQMWRSIPPTHGNFHPYSTLRAVTEVTAVGSKVSDTAWSVTRRLGAELTREVCMSELFRREAVSHATHRLSGAV